MRILPLRSRLEKRQNWIRQTFAYESIRTLKFVMQYWKGCTAVITGASSGIGEELARQLAPVASRLILVARREDRLNAIAEELRTTGAEVECHRVDLADGDDVARFCASMRDVPVDLLINNAGLGDHGLFESADWDRLERIIDVNITALTRLTHGLLPGMRRRGRGTIMNISSIASLTPVPKLAVYAASKAYVTSLSEALRAELHGTGINVIAVCPGPVQTEFGSVANRPNSQEQIDSPPGFRVDVETVGRAALRAAARGRARVIPGWKVALAMSVVAVLPMFVVRAVLRRIR
jgi:short-subunit dehydrogenase